MLCRTPQKNPRTGSRCWGPFSLCVPGPGGICEELSVLSQGSWQLEGTEKLGCKAPSNGLPDGLGNLA